MGESTDGSTDRPETDSPGQIAPRRLLPTDDLGRRTPTAPATTSVASATSWSATFGKTNHHCVGGWDHVAFDPEHKPVLAVIPGARAEEDACAVVA